MLLRHEDKKHRISRCIWDYLLSSLDSTVAVPTPLITDAASGISSVTWENPPPLSANSSCSCWYKYAPKGVRKRLHGTLKAGRKTLTKADKLGRNGTLPRPDASPASAPATPDVSGGTVSSSLLKALSSSPSSLNTHKCVRCQLRGHFTAVEPHQLLRDTVVACAINVERNKQIGTFMSFSQCEQHVCLCPIQLRELLSS